MSNRVTRGILTVLCCGFALLCAPEAGAQRYAPDGSVIPDAATSPDDSSAPPATSPDDSNAPPALSPDAVPADPARPPD